MNSVSLDTNAYRALDDGNPVVAKIVNQALTIGLPIIMLGELYFGFENGSRKAENFANLNRLLQTPRTEILQLDSQTARIFGEIATGLEKSGKPMQQNDIWIAALCKQYGSALLTADKGFANIVGLDVLTF